ncbi:hypothetical protein ACET3X_007951 [Alternaria dauci]|uniref:Zn(2)-C6 fungal-type domain-containing protein n=1 Tax=Alternaria dauci TaxID=48095 RepID=A0ABR3UDU2_9PLEO
MAEQAPVLWCGQCKKPFSKRSTLKRHGYYCRYNSRASVPRRRSCTACAQAKTGCDNALPACSRCLQKDITCKYPSGSAAKRRNAVETSRDVIYNLNNSDHDRVNMVMPTVLGQVQDIREVTPAPEDSTLFTDVQWNLHDTVAFDDFMHSPPGMTAFSTAPSFSLASTGPTPVSPPLLLPETADAAFQEHSQLTPQQQHPGSQTVSLSIPPTPNQNVRSMMQRPKMHSRADKTSSLIYYTFKSYLLMLRQNNLPPFIHPSCVSFTDDDTTNEPLENCIALVHMIASGVRGSRRLFWRNVKQECERMCDQNQTLSKWELLGAMQALSVYVLIRLDEGETEHNHLDHLLERAVILVAMQLSHDDFDCHADYVSCHSTSESNWQDWVYKESRRRLAVIYRVLDKLVFFGPAAMCDMPAEFVIAPLPAKRQLWEARDAQEWKFQSQAEPQGHTSYALAVDGEIIKLDQRRLSCRDAWLPYTPSDEGTASQIHDIGSSSSRELWAEWCSGIDGMGGLIMLVASMT